MRGRIYFIMHFRDKSLRRNWTLLKVNSSTKDVIENIIWFSVVAEEIRKWQINECIMVNDNLVFPYKKTINYNLMESFIENLMQMCPKSPSKITGEAVCYRQWTKWAPLFQKTIGMWHGFIWNKTKMGGKINILFVSPQNNLAETIGNDEIY